MEWLRLWHDMPNDPKWRTIARLSKQPIALVQALYLHLLVDASMSETRGNADVTVEDLASALDADEEQIEAIITAMQGRVLEDRWITGWEKRQPKRNDDSKDRVRKYRAKKAEESGDNGGPNGGGNGSGNDESNDGNDDVTQGNDGVTPRLEESREDKSKDIEKNPCASGDAPPPNDTEPLLYSDEFNRFWAVYPSKKGKKPAAEKFRTVRKKHSSQEFLERLIEDVQSRARSHEWTKSNGQFIPMASTYLNQERWNDPPPVTAVVDGTTRFVGRQSVEEHNREVAARWVAGGGDLYDTE